jgi:biopolymer transport protein ExbD
MAKIKVKRRSVSLDMTAMCDVAFLLLTFFMLTTKFKEDEPVTVDTPSSIAEIPIPDTDLMLITLDKEGHIFFSVDRQKTRYEMLRMMGEKYNIQFTNEELGHFALTTMFGVEINQMKQFLSLSKSERLKLKQPGIPADSVKNELKDWIYSARKANQSQYQKPMRIAIKGDQDANAPAVKKIIATLQDQEINKFNFITDLEALPDFLKKTRKSEF